MKQTNFLQSGLLAIKIGGSLFSDKEQKEHLEPNAISIYAGLIKTLHKKIPGRLVVIIGGGSYGHGAVRNLNPQELYAALDLTEANFRLKWYWFKALRAVNVPAVPLQAMAFSHVVENESKRKISSAPNVLTLALAQGACPLITGDSLFSTNGPKIVGSDEIAECLLDLNIKSTRFVALTSSAGVLQKSNGSTIPIIKNKSQLKEKSTFWPTPDYDVTGAMKGKVAAMRRLQKLGIDCAIAHGPSALSDPLSLLKNYHDLPTLLPCTIFES